MSKKKNKCRLCGSMYGRRTFKGNTKAYCSPACEKAQIVKNAFLRIPRHWLLSYRVRLVMPVTPVQDYSQLEARIASMLSQDVRDDT